MQSVLKKKRKGCGMGRTGCGVLELPETAAGGFAAERPAGTR